MDKKNSEYIGKEMYGFRFQNESYITYNAPHMDKFIGKVGKIIDSSHKMVIVRFEKDPNTWHYPIPLVDDNLLENEPPVNLDELFNKISKIC